jgi:hypothetical protein
MAFNKLGGFEIGSGLKGIAVKQFHNLFTLMSECSFEASCMLIDYRQILIILPVSAGVLAIC